jgi:hypothetical protein
LIQLLLLITILLLVFLAVRRILAASRSAAQGVQRMLLWGVLILLAILAATGRLGIIVPIVGALVAALIRLLPVLLQFFPLLQRLLRERAAQRAAADSRSTAETKYLRMHLEHATGAISGLVLAGPFAGRDLQSMTLDELAHLYRHCAGDDQDSATLLAAYLDRVHGQTWRQGGQPGGSGSRRGSNEMTVAEAYEVLGLAPGASREAIIEAHRRLMQKVHPDRGGSDFLAANVNRAKEVLLSR